MATLTTTTKMRYYEEDRTVMLATPPPLPPPSHGDDALLPLWLLIYTQLRITLNYEVTSTPPPTLTTS